MEIGSFNLGYQLAVADLAVDVALQEVAATLIHFQAPLFSGGYGDGNHVLALGAIQTGGGAGFLIGLFGHGHDRFISPSCALSSKCRGYCC